MQPFTKEQLEQICKILQSQNLVNPNPFGFVAKKGNHFLSSCLNVESSVSWIVDFGATDHMTGCSNFFSSHSPCAGNQRVKIANGTFQQWPGKGLLLSRPILHFITFFTFINCPVIFFQSVNLFMIKSVKLISRHLAVCFRI